jgi:DNA-binding NarL/FixJ family response regulator
MTRQQKSASTAGDVIRICLIEDHTLVRAGLRMLLEKDHRLQVVYEAASVTETLAAADRDRPDIILLDISLRGENGLEFLPELLRLLAPARVIVLTALEDTEAHLYAMERGASGVVLKEQAPDVLVKAIYSVHSGEAWIGNSISAAAIAKLSRVRVAKEQIDPEAEKIAHLTPREREIIAIVAQGYNGARIAAELRISEATVRHHTTSILAKLELSNKLELAVYALQHGLGPKAEAAEPPPGWIRQAQQDPEGRRQAAARFRGFSSS